MVTAVLLVGGGSAGIIQCGMIQALIEAGVKPDVVYGSSVGALNGICWYQNELNVMERIWLSIESRDVYHDGPIEVATAFTRCALYSSEPLANLLKSLIKPELSTPPPFQFKVTATNMRLGTSLCLDLASVPAGVQWEWLLASASPPILMPPVKINQHDLFCDGGFLSNANIKFAIEDGATELYILLPRHPQGYSIHNLIDSIMFTLTAASGYMVTDELSFVQILNQDAGKQEVKVHLVIPDEMFPNSILDFNLGNLANRQRLIKIGYDAYQQYAKLRAA